MTTLSIISLVTGSAGVILTIRQSIWCWPMALIATLTSAADFYAARLYGDMALQGLYFITGIYGWIYWNRESQEAFKVSRMPAAYILPLLGLTVIQAVLYYFALRFFKGDVVLVDAVLTATSVTVTYMMTRKWFENWWCWVVIDTFYVGLYFYKQMPLYALLYLIFTAMALYGAISWKKVRV
ncbi:MAG: nicotinamide riboside transporter PnuC [Sediminibacterium sp.]|nr:nicotinamide riboside transporter PnuC [Sediminibacterium sp.]